MFVLFCWIWYGFITFLHYCVCFGYICCSLLWFGGFYWFQCVWVFPYLFPFWIFMWVAENICTVWLIGLRSSGLNNSCFLFAFMGWVNTIIFRVAKVNSRSTFIPYLFRIIFWKFSRFQFELRLLIRLGMYASLNFLAIGLWFSTLGFFSHLKFPKCAQEPQYNVKM